MPFNLAPLVACSVDALRLMRNGADKLDTSEMPGRALRVRRQDIASTMDELEDGANGENLSLEGVGPAWIRICEVDFEGPLGLGITGFPSSPGCRPHVSVHSICSGPRANFWVQCGLHALDLIWSINGQFPGDTTAVVGPRC